MNIGGPSIKIKSYQYMDPRVKDQMVWRSSYLKHGNPIPGKDDLYIETGPASINKFTTTRFNTMGPKQKPTL